MPACNEINLDAKTYFLYSDECRAENLFGHSAVIGLQVNGFMISEQLKQKDQLRKEKSF